MDALFTSVVRLSEQGLSLKKISKQLNISEQKARKILITAGGVVEPAVGLNRCDDEKRERC